jgi:hypothetical protein
MSIDPQDWEKRSECGEICGMLGCNNPPTTQCPECKTHYCDEHKVFHRHQLK